MNEGTKPLFILLGESLDIAVTLVEVKICFLVIFNARYTLYLLKLGFQRFSFSPA